MGFAFKKRVKLCKGLYINFGKNGISTSLKVGNITHNSKGGTTVNLGNGLTYRTGKTKVSNKRTTENVEPQFNIDNLSDRGKKIYTIGTKITWFICGILGLVLSLAIPIILPFAIGCIIFAIKYKVK